MTPEKSLIFLTPLTLNNLRQLIGFLLIGLCFLLSSGSGFADETDDESDDYLCAEAVVAKGEEMLEEFQSFLDEYLSQNVPTSEQVEMAMSYYRYFESTMHETYEESMDFRGDRSFELVSSEVSLCTYRRDRYLDEAALRLQTSIRYATSTKSSYQFIDGLKAMNESMEDFSRDFHEVFPGKFNEMNSSLTCFAKECIGG